MQLEYGTPARGFAGMIADSHTRDIDSPLAQGAIAFGHGVVSDEYETCREPGANRGTVAFSGVVVTSNKINGKVNGVAITEVTFDSSAANTYSLIAAQIVAKLATVGITATTSVNTNTITVTTANGEDLVFSEWLVTAGASQATVSHTYTDTGYFRGIAVAAPNGMPIGGEASYVKGDAVNVLRRGRAFVTISGTVAANATLYLILTGDNKGKFTSTAGSNLATTVKALEAAADATLCKVELNLP